MSIHQHGGTSAVEMASNADLRAEQTASICPTTDAQATLPRTPRFAQKTNGLSTPAATQKKHRWPIPTREVEEPRSSQDTAPSASTCSSPLMELVPVLASLMRPQQQCHSRPSKKSRSPQKILQT
jgi:hypothetical protein